MWERGIERRYRGGRGTEKGCIKSGIGVQREDINGEGYKEEAEKGKKVK